MNLNYSNTQLKIQNSLQNVCQKHKDIMSFLHMSLYDTQSHHSSYFYRHRSAHFTNNNTSSSLVILLTSLPLCNHFLFLLLELAFLIRLSSFQVMYAKT